MRYNTGPCVILNDGGYGTSVLSDGAPGSLSACRVCGLWSLCRSVKLTVGLWSVELTGVWSCGVCGLCRSVELTVGLWSL